MNPLTRQAALMLCPTSHQSLAKLQASIEHTVKVLMSSEVHVYQHRFPYFVHPATSQTVWLEIMLPS